MAAQRSPYVYGNAARNLEVEPVRREEIDRRYVTQRPRPRTKPRARVDKVAVLLTCITFVAVMAAGIIYLRLQFQSTYLNKSVVSLQTEVMDMEKENSAALKDLDNSLDLSAIYEKATKELGMSEPEESQVDTYESRKSTQVRTHADIPEE